MSLLTTTARKQATSPCPCKSKQIGELLIIICHYNVGWNGRRKRVTPYPTTRQTENAKRLLSAFYPRIVFLNLIISIAVLPGGICTALPKTSLFRPRFLSLADTTTKQKTIQAESPFILEGQSTLAVDHQAKRILAWA